MREPVVSYKVAKLAKDKGFGGFGLVTEGKYCRGGLFVNMLCNNKSDFCREDEFSAPTKSLLQKWIREKYNIHIEIKPIPFGENGFKWIYELGLIEISSLDNVSRRNTYSILINKERVYFDDYEEALDDGLFEALKSIKV